MSTSPIPLHRPGAERPRRAAARTRQRGRARLVVLLAAILSALGGLDASAATAGTYTIHQCDGGAMTPDGWTGANNGSYTYLVLTCSSSTPLSAYWNAGYPRVSGDFATVTFTAAANTTLTRAQAYRETVSYPAVPFGTPLAGFRSDTTVQIEQNASSGGTLPGAPNSYAGWVDFGLADAASMWMTVGCWGGGACPDGNISYRMRSITVTARDSSAPTLSGVVSGSLATRATLHGSEEVTANMVDRGAGVYRVKLLQDNTVKDTRVVDGNGGRCADVNAGNSDPYEFAYRVPCKLSASGTWSLDSAAVTDGEHNIKVQIEDAAGNSTTVVNRTVTVDNLPPIVSSPAITGAAVENETLVCQASVQGQAASIAYAWLRANPDGSGQEVIAGATDPAYALVAADVGHKVLCRVTATDLGGTTAVSSAITEGPFASGALVALAPPTVTPAVVVGTMVEGEAVNCEGTVTGTASSTSIRWLRTNADGSGAVPIDGATARSYDLRAADVGHRIACSVIGENAAGTATSTSDPLARSVVVTKPVVGDGAHGSDGSDGHDGSTPSTVDQPRSGGGVPNPPNPLDAPPPANAANTATGAKEAASKDLNVVPVANPDARGENGTPADPQAVISVYFQLNAGSAKRTASAATAGFSQRLRIRGKIKARDGRPIVGAKLYLAQTTGKKDGNGNALWRLNGGTVSRDDGSVLMFSTASGKNRQIRLVYFPYGGRVANRGSNILALKVRQEATLKLTRRQLRNGQTLGFSGKVRGLVRQGTKVQLQVKLAAGWSTFRQAQVASTGRFHARWTFRRTTSRTVYRFRVRVRPASGAGYVSSTSGARKVVVRP